MKRNKKYVIIFGFIFLLIAVEFSTNILTHGYFIIGRIVGNTIRARHKTSNSKKPPQEDFISSALNDKLNDKIFYDRKVEDEDDFGCTHYYFQITEYNKELITTITDTVNNSLEEYYKKEPNNIAPIEIQLYKKGRPHDTTLAKLSNYICEADICDSKLIALYICGTTNSGLSLYDYICSYGGVKNIIQLELKKSIYDCIKDDGINVDWYKIFPDLKQFFVDGQKYINGKDYISDQNPNDSISKAIKNKLDNKIYYLGKDDSDDTGVDYNFLIMDFHKELITDIADIVNDILEKDYKKNPDKIPPVIIWLYVQTDDNSTATLASFSNFMRVLDADYSKCSPQLIDLYINGVTDSSSHITNNHEISDAYNNASAYVSLKGIKAFTANEALDENAKSEGINWYEVWPELENYTVFPTTSPTPSPIPEWSGLESFSTKPESSSAE